MARIAQPDDFTIDVEGVGTFTFGQRSMRDEIKIQVEYARLIEGVQPTEWLGMVAGWMSVLKVLTVRAPADWDLDALDPLDPDTYAKLAKVHQLLTEKERSFRSGSREANQTAGEAAGANG